MQRYCKAIPFITPQSKSSKYHYAITAGKVYLYNQNMYQMNAFINIFVTTSLQHFIDVFELI